MESIDYDLVQALNGNLGMQFADRRTELWRRFRTPPPRPGGSNAVVVVVVHHTAGSTRNTYGDIWNYHVKRLGWSAPGYGLWVGRGGVVELGATPSQITWGVWGRHELCYNIALPGDYRRDEMTPEQADALYRTLCCIDDAYGWHDYNEYHVYGRHVVESRFGLPWRGHKETALKVRPTACPGQNIMKHLINMRQDGGSKPRPDHYRMV